MTTVDLYRRLSARMVELSQKIAIANNPISTAVVLGRNPDGTLVVEDGNGGCANTQPRAAAYAVGQRLIIGMQTSVTEGNVAASIAMPAILPPFKPSFLPPSSFSVIYNGNGYDAGEMPTDSTPYGGGDTALVMDIGGTPADDVGLSFVEWNTRADGSGTSYSAGDTFTMPSSNVTLYARWAMLTDLYFRDLSGSGTTSHKIAYPTIPTSGVASFAITAGDGLPNNPDTPYTMTFVDNGDGTATFSKDNTQLIVGSSGPHTESGGSYWEVIVTVTGAGIGSTDHVIKLHITAT